MFVKYYSFVIRLFPILFLYILNKKKKTSTWNKKRTRKFIAKMQKKKKKNNINRGGQ